VAGTPNPSPLADFVHAALGRCAVSGLSLRAVARAAEMPASMLSQIRHGRLGVPLARVGVMTRALELDAADARRFQMLVRSDQARRGVYRGTAYVAELEAMVADQRRLLQQVVDGTVSGAVHLPDELRQRIADALQDDAADRPPGAVAGTEIHPWSSAPSEDNGDREALEARNDRGVPVMAEYRLRLRDAEGRLVHGDIVIAPGIDAAMQHLRQRYATGELGQWPPGWYLCEVIRKAAPSASVEIAWHIV